MLRMHRRPSRHQSTTNSDIDWPIRIDAKHRRIAMQTGSARKRKKPARRWKRAVSPLVRACSLFVRVYLVSAPTGKLVGSRLKLRLRSDLQFFHDPLTLRCDDIGAAAKLSSNLFVCFPFGEAPQQLLLLRRQLVVVSRWYSLQVGLPIRPARPETPVPPRIGLAFSPSLYGGGP